MTTVNAIVEGTGLRTRRPVPQIQRFLGCYFALTHAPGVKVQTLPDASSYLVVELPRESAARCVLAGPRLKSVGSTPPREIIDIVGVRLLPGVSFLLTGKSADAFVEQRPLLSTFLGSCATELAERMVAQDTELRFNLLESFLLERLSNVCFDGRVRTALRLIEESAGSVPVEKLAQCCRLSVRQLERLLRTWVGISPKRLARIARFQSLLHRTQAKPDSHWTNLAAEQDYVDQAHMIHEFSSFTGASPTKFSPLNSAKSLKAGCD